MKEHISSLGKGDDLDLQADIYLIYKNRLKGGYLIFIKSVHLISVIAM
jgi:hypothetical protein